MNQSIEAETHDGEEIGQPNNEPSILQLKAPTDELARLLDGHEHTC